MNAIYMHRQALKLSYDISASDPVSEKAEMFFQTGSERASSFSKVEMIFSNWFPVTPQVQDVLNGITNVSKCRGVLLEEVHLYPGGRKQNVLETGGITQCEVPASEFAYPTGFKQSSLREIMQEKQKAREMSDVMQDLFIDDNKKK